MVKCEILGSVWKEKGKMPEFPLYPGRSRNYTTDGAASILIDFCRIIVICNFYEIVPMSVTRCRKCVRAFFF